MKIWVDRRAINTVWFQFCFLQKWLSWNWSLLRMEGADPFQHRGSITCKKPWAGGRPGNRGWREREKPPQGGKGIDHAEHWRLGQGVWFSPEIDEKPPNSLYVTHEAQGVPMMLKATQWASGRAGSGWGLYEEPKPGLNFQSPTSVDPSLLIKCILPRPVPSLFRLGFSISLFLSLLPLPPSAFHKTTEKAHRSVHCPYPLRGPSSLDKTGPS